MTETNSGPKHTVVLLKQINEFSHGLFCKHSRSTAGFHMLFVNKVTCFLSHKIIINKLLKDWFIWKWTKTFLKKHIYSFILSVCKVTSTYLIKWLTCFKISIKVMFFLHLRLLFTWPMYSSKEPVTSGRDILYFKHLIHEILTF